jgi:hypothetical protein
MQINGKELLGKETWPEAKDYLVTDGKDEWVSFHSRASGGWWTRRKAPLTGYDMEKRKIIGYRECKS